MNILFHEKKQTRDKMEMEMELKKNKMEKKDDLVKVKFQPVQFSEPEITMFKYMSCRNNISASTDVSNPNSPMWVNFGVLS